MCKEELPGQAQINVAHVADSFLKIGLNVVSVGLVYETYFFRQVF